MNDSPHGGKGPVRILVIEDSEEIQEATRLIFDIHWPEAQILRATRGREGLSLMASQSPDLVILDLGLPDMDGMRVLKEIRESSDVPVIILTVRGEETDKVRGLELGADDFIVKPFGHRELLARIGAVRNRRKVVRNSMEMKVPAKPPRAIIVDSATGEAYVNDRLVKMTNTEKSLLKYLASNKGTHLSDEKILADVWGKDYIDCSEYLDVYIRRLREKIEDDTSKPAIILRQKDGYVFTDTD